jgi:hypothetical protein
MRAISKMMVLVVVFAMVAGSVSAAEMTFDEAVEAVKKDGWAANAALWEASGHDRQKIVDALEQYKNDSLQVAQIYAYHLIHIPTDTPEQVENEIRTLEDVHGRSFVGDLQGLASVSGDKAFQERILVETIDKDEVNRYWAPRLCEKLDNPKLTAEVVKALCLKYAGNADLLAKQTLKLLSSVYAEGVISGENYLPENVCVALIKQVVGASTARYQTLSSSSEASEKLSKGIQAWKALGADQFGIVWSE